MTVRLPGISALVTKNEKFSVYFKDDPKESLNMGSMKRLRGCYEVFVHVCGQIQSRAIEFRDMDTNMKKL
jgi:hypothetical protein